MKKVFVVETATRIFRVPAYKVTGRMQKFSRSVLFWLSLSDKLKSELTCSLTEEEAAQVISNFQHRFPDVKAQLDRVNRDEARPLVVCCNKCASSRVIKSGTAFRWKSGVKVRRQMYLCNACGHRIQGEVIGEDANSVSDTKEE